MASARASIAAARSAALAVTPRDQPSDRALALDLEPVGGIVVEGRHIQKTMTVIDERAWLDHAPGASARSWGKNRVWRGSRATVGHENHGNARANGSLLGASLSEMPETGPIKLRFGGRRRQNRRKKKPGGEPGWKRLMMKETRRTR